VRSPLTGFVYAAHLTEMQARLNEARSILGLAEVVFSRSNPATGSIIRAADVVELRVGVR
jgi:hypothetical protein